MLNPLLKKFQGLCVTAGHLYRDSIRALARCSFGPSELDPVRRNCRLHFPRRLAICNLLFGTFGPRFQSCNMDSHLIPFTRWTRCSSYHAKAIQAAYSRSKTGYRRYNLSSFPLFVLLLKSHRLSCKSGGKYHS